MAEIVNLRRVRRAAARARAEQDAAEARRRHGRTLVEREAEQREAERLRRAVEGAALSEGSSEPR